MHTDTLDPWPGKARPAEWSVWPDRPDEPGRGDRLDGIVRQLDDADAHDMTLLRLVLAVALAMVVLGLVVQLLG